MAGSQAWAQAQAAEPAPSGQKFVDQSCKLPEKAPGKAGRAKASAGAPFAAASAAQGSGLETFSTDLANPPVVLSARNLFSRIGEETQAEGEAELKRGGLRLTADSLRYLHATDRVQAQGNVLVEREGDVYTGTQADVTLNSKQGFLLSPGYHFARTGAGGQAARLDFKGPQRLSANEAQYSSCEPADGGEPDWELRMKHLDLDFEHNEGRAEGAVLRFLGVPVLAFPVLSFPATTEAKSGLLPPTINLDSRGGVEIQQPYYFRLAPNYDLTLTPSVSSRRGSGLRTEFRYLQDNDAGRLNLHSQPHDSLANRERHSIFWEHQGHFGRSYYGNWNYQVSWQGASDDDYWKDFSRQLPSLTPRLLPQELQLERSWDAGPDIGTADSSGALRLFARVQRWQVLQGSDTITVPYDRVPQFGLQGEKALAWGVRLGANVEAAHFQLRDRTSGDTRPDGDRVYTELSLARRHDLGWGWFTPRLSWSGTQYATDSAMADGRTRAWRSLPSFSLDAGLRMERSNDWFGGGNVQTLEPRLHFVNTPRRDQSALPLFDTAASDFNSLSIYADNAFTGVDRLSDARQVTLGATSRLLDAVTGAEKLRFGAAQRYQLRLQDLTVEGTPSTQRLSDLLLFGSGSPWPKWHLDTTLQYNTDVARPVRSIISARYQPQDFHTLVATYRYARDLSEQVELGWQWPLWRSQPKAWAPTSGQGGGQSCGGTLYGVGRVNYSLRDKRSTDSLYGVEYDAGCWILRVVVQRESTAATESNRRTMLQLELIGLSRLGSNPLQVLKDNIAGYRLLRDEAGTSSSATSSASTP